MAQPVRLAVLILGLISLIVVGGGIVLALNDKTIPDALIAIGAGAAGAVAGILVPNRT